MATYEFDVTVRVRKRMILSGPTSTDAARDALKQTLSSGMAPDIFAKRDRDGHAIETVLDNDIVIEDVS